MSRLLVTGGAGFIGSHLVDSLIADGHTVTAFDNFDPFYDRQLKERNVDAHRRHPRWRLIEGDLRRPEDISRLGDEYDVIVHLAAKAGVRPSIDNPLEYQSVNVGGTQLLLEHARVCKIPHFVFASSSSVYGINSRVPWSESDPVLLPISPYASTKVSGELLGHVYSHLYGIRFIALRFFTVYGPRQRPDLAMTKFARLMRNGDPIPVFGDGSTRRDYTYVDDIVAGLRAAIDYERTSYEVINIGNNLTLSLAEMIDGLEEALGIPARRQYLPEQPGDVPQTWADVTKAKALLGYEPKTRYQEGVRRLVAWLQSPSVVVR